MKSEFKQGRWGVEFRNGKLYSFENHSVLVIRCWPPAAWRQCEEHGWRRCSDVGDEVVRIEHSSTLPGPEPPPPSVIPIEKLIKVPTYEPDLSDEENLRIWNACERINWAERRKDAAFWGPVPVAIRDAVSQYDYGRWRILTLLARCPQALDLHRSNPALLFALAHHDLFHQPPAKDRYRAVRRLLVRRQRDILGWLGFPATEAARKALRKITAQRASLQALRDLRQILPDQRLAKMAAHLPRLTEALLTIINTPHLRASVPRKLLHDISAGNLFDADIVVSAFQMSSDLGMGIWPKRLWSMDEVWDVFCKACERGEALSMYPRLREKNGVQTGQATFPLPPFCGTPDIVPIRTAEALAEEARFMRHCANVFREQIIAGEAYLYQVLAPVRATLSICKTNEGWCRDLCGGVANQIVDRDVMEGYFASLFASGELVEEDRTPGRQTDTSDA